ncbi:hypothetical protein HDV00_007074 [Rhizophlyctis rosea]|nr:hypothetical protein HDV00_007074 [Rhizophlyctis rosea]
MVDESGFLHLDREGLKSVVGVGDVYAGFMGTTPRTEEGGGRGNNRSSLEVWRRSFSIESSRKRFSFEKPVNPVVLNTVSFQIVSADLDTPTLTPATLRLTVRVPFASDSCVSQAPLTPPASPDSFRHPAQQPSSALTILHIRTKPAPNLLHWHASVRLAIALAVTVERFSSGWYAPQTPPPSPPDVFVSPPLPRSVHLQVPQRRDSRSPPPARPPSPPSDIAEPTTAVIQPELAHEEQASTVSKDRAERPPSPPVDTLAQELGQELVKLKREVEFMKEEKTRSERKYQKEMQESEKKMRAMFSAEEVQDVYQETADKLSDAEARIQVLELQLSEQKTANQTLTRDIHHLRTTYEAPLGEYNCLLLRHEELCKKYEALRREVHLVQMKHDKERMGHQRLATLLRKQAMERVEKLDDELDGKQEDAVVFGDEPRDTSFGG